MKEQRTMGIDPGTKSFDIVAGEGESIFLRKSISTKDLMQEPSRLAVIIEDALPLDVIVAPSGFGLPIKPVQNLTKEDIFEMTLKRTQKGPVVGLHKILALFQKHKWNAYTIPGVKHLPSVPMASKVNKIDLGTADKLCSTAYCISHFMEHFSFSLNEMSLIILEIGYGFASLIAVENGRIIDGIGGTQVMGPRCIGALDGELAYLKHHLTKTDIYSGGFLSHLKKDISFSEALQYIDSDPKIAMYFEAFLQALIKALSALITSFRDPKKIQNIYICGRNGLDPGFKPYLEDLCRDLPSPIFLSKEAGTTKIAAQGANILANGLSGGKYRALVEHLKIKEASGSIFDHLPLGWLKS